jgi:hypothetical protein
MTVSPYKKLEKDAYLLIDRMYNHEPIVVRMMKQEKGMICCSCNNINRNLSRLIIHLNDDHYMNYQQIADHLEDIGL